MKVFPVNRMQKFFREQEMLEHAKLQAKGIHYFGGPGDLREALLAEDRHGIDRTRARRETCGVF
jgi:hypothetical protein